MEHLRVLDAWPSCISRKRNGRSSIIARHWASSSAIPFRINNILCMILLQRPCIVREMSFSGKTGDTRHRMQQTMQFSATAFLETSSCQRSPRRSQRSKSIYLSQLHRLHPLIGRLERPVPDVTIPIRLRKI